LADVDVDFDAVLDFVGFFDLTNGSEKVDADCSDVFVSGLASTSAVSVLVVAFLGAGSEIEFKCFIKKKTQIIFLDNSSIRRGAAANGSLAT